jgi:hypothetical protein
MGANREYEIWAATKWDRDSGELNHHQRPVSEGGKQANSKPFCFAGGPVEFGEKPTAESIRKEINRDRKCDQYFPWRKGMHPRDAAQERFMVELEQRREEFERTSEHDRRKFENELFDRGHNVQESIRDLTKKMGRFTKGVSILVVFLAFVQIIIAVVSIVLDN